MRAGARSVRLQGLLNRCHIWIERVPNEENLSDLPSRERHELLSELGATWRRPAIAQLFVESLFLESGVQARPVG